MFGPALLLVLLSLCSGGSSHQSRARTVAFAGETAVLPCHTKHIGDHQLTVEWAKDERGLDPNIIFLYRGGRETREMINHGFWYRTHFFMNELSKGNISLRISNVQLSDAGIYKCKTIRGYQQEVVTVELTVVKVPEPKLSAVPADGRGVTFKCEAACSFPRPEMMFLDDEGQVITPQEEPQTVQGEGCFSITGTITLQSATSRIVCRVQQLDINRMDVAEIYIPADCRRSCTVSIVRTIYFFIAAVGGASILVVFLCRKFDPLGYEQILESDDDSLQRQNNEQQEMVNKKDKTIRQQASELILLRSKQDSVGLLCSKPAVSQSPSTSVSDVSKPMNPPSHQNLEHNNPKAANKSQQISGRRKHSKPGPDPLVDPGAAPSSSSPGSTMHQSAKSSTASRSPQKSATKSHSWSTDEAASPFFSRNPYEALGTE